MLKSDGDQHVRHTHTQIHMHAQTRTQAQCTLWVGLKDTPDTMDDERSLTMVETNSRFRCFSVMCKASPSTFASLCCSQRSSSRKRPSNRAQMTGCPKKCGAGCMCLCTCMCVLSACVCVCLGVSRWMAASHIEIPPVFLCTLPQFCKGVDPRFGKQVHRGRIPSPSSPNLSYSTAKHHAAFTTLDSC